MVPFLEKFIINCRIPEHTLVNEEKYSWDIIYGHFQRGNIVLNLGTENNENPNCELHNTDHQPTDMEDLIDSSRKIIIK